jgi:hypothetical protein
MEIKEAISRIENVLDPFPFDPPFSPETCEALDMAIDALRILGDEDTISRKKIIICVNKSSSKYLNGQAKSAMCRIVRNVPRKYEERRTDG